MEIIITVVSFIAILALLVIVHEFGHYFAAKKNGVLVEEFGFGFPPRAWGKKIGETLYSINWLPIGGFVKVYGEEYYEEDTHVDPKLKNRAFVSKKPWQKAIIIVAGVVMNFLLGWAIFSFLLATEGKEIPTNKVVIQEVQKNSPADKAGLQVGDQIAEIRADGKANKLTQSEQLISLTQQYQGKEITLITIRDTKQSEVTITPRKNPPPGEGSMGVVLNSFTLKQYPWYQAPYYGFIEAATLTQNIAIELLKILFRFITFQQQQVDVAGPIGIARFTGQAVEYGHVAVLQLIALLSLNLAVINILPFPALDGGRLVFIIYEWITGKMVNKNFERYMNAGGMILLLSLSALITVLDIVKLF